MGWQLFLWAERCGRGAGKLAQHAKRHNDQTFLCVGNLRARSVFSEDFVGVEARDLLDSGLYLDE